jgi:hypothetical protein
MTDRSIRKTSLMWLVASAAPHLAISLIYLVWLKADWPVWVGGEAAAIVRLLVFLSGPAVFIGNSGTLYFATTAAVMIGSFAAWYAARRSLPLAIAIATLTVVVWLLCPFVLLVAYAA